METQKTTRAQYEKEQNFHRATSSYMYVRPPNYVHTPAYYNYNYWPRTMDIDPRRIYHAGYAVGMPWIRWHNDAMAHPYVQTRQRHNIHHAKHMSENQYELTSVNSSRNKFKFTDPEKECSNPNTLTKTWTDDCGEYLKDRMQDETMTIEKEFFSNQRHIKKKGQSLKISQDACSQCQTNADNEDDVMNSKEVVKITFDEISLNGSENLPTTSNFEKCSISNRSREGISEPTDSSDKTDKNDGNSFCLIEMYEKDKKFVNSGMQTDSHSNMPDEFCATCQGISRQKMDSVTHISLEQKVRYVTHKAIKSIRVCPDLLKCPKEFEDKMKHKLHSLCQIFGDNSNSLDNGRICHLAIRILSMNFDLFEKSGDVLILRILLGSSTYGLESSSSLSEKYSSHGDLCASEHDHKIVNTKTNQTDSSCPRKTHLHENLMSRGDIRCPSPSPLAVLAVKEINRNKSFDPHNFISAPSNKAGRQNEEHAPQSTKSFLLESQAPSKRCSETLAMSAMKSCRDVSLEKDFQSLSLDRSDRKGANLPHTGTKANLLSPTITSQQCLHDLSSSEENYLEEGKKNDAEETKACFNERKILAAADTLAGCFRSNLDKLVPSGGISIPPKLSPNYPKGLGFHPQSAIQNPNLKAKGLPPPLQFGKKRLLNHSHSATVDKGDSFSSNTNISRFSAHEQNVKGHTLPIHEISCLTSNQLKNGNDGQCCTKGFNPNDLNVFKDQSKSQSSSLNTGSRYGNIFDLTNPALLHSSPPDLMDIGSRSGGKSVEYDLTSPSTSLKHREEKRRIVSKPPIIGNRTTTHAQPNQPECRQLLPQPGHSKEHKARRPWFSYKERNKRILRFSTNKKTNLDIVKSSNPFDWQTVQSKKLPGKIPLSVKGKELFRQEVDPGLVKAVREAHPLLTKSEAKDILAKVFNATYYLDGLKQSQVLCEVSLIVEKEYPDLKMRPRMEENMRAGDIGENSSDDDSSTSAVWSNFISTNPYNALCPEEKDLRQN